MTEPRESREQRHILMALPQLSRLPYHVSTIAALDELGAKVTVVFCRRRKKDNNIPVTRAASAAEFLSWVDSIPRLHPNVTFFEENVKRSSIRSRDLTGPSRSWPRTLRSYSSYLRRLGHGNKYTERWRSYLPPWLRRLTVLPPVRALLRTDRAFRRLSELEARIPPDPGIHEWIVANGVDAVVASPTNQRNSPEVEFVKSASHWGVPTAVSVLSWDALSTKGLIPCPPTMLLAWNGAHARDAVEIHGLDPDSVVVAGSPFFDKWFRDGDGDGDRADALRELGLAADARYLVYLGSSTNIALNEAWLVEQIRGALDATPELADLELVVRPHPANARMVEDLSGLPRVHVEPSGLPYSEEMQQSLARLIRSSEAFIGVNTSGMLDAIILGKPGFSILSDRYRETHAEALHFQHMVEGDVLYLDEDAAAFAKRLARVLGGEDPKAENRRRFVETFIRPRGLDRDAGRVQAEAILMLASGKSPPEIDAALAQRSS